MRNTHPHHSLSSRLSPLRALLITCALALPLWAHAQPLPDPHGDLGDLDHDDDHGPPGPPDDLDDDDHDPPDHALRAAIRAQIQDARAAAVRDQLGLDPATAATIDATLRAHDEAIHAARASMRAAHKALRDAMSLPSPPDDATLDALISNVTSARAAMHTAEWNIHVTVKPLLTTQQRAALILFLPAFERQVRALIRHARRGDAKGGKGGKGDRHGPPRPHRRSPPPHP